MHELSLEQLKQLAVLAFQKYGEFAVIGFYSNDEVWIKSDDESDDAWRAVWIGDSWELTNEHFAD